MKPRENVKELATSLYALRGPNLRIEVNPGVGPHSNPVAFFKPAGDRGGTDLKIVEDVFKRAGLGPHVSRTTDGQLRFSTLIPKNKPQNPELVRELCSHLRVLIKQNE